MVVWSDALGDHVPCSFAVCWQFGDFSRLFHDDFASFQVSEMSNLGFLGEGRRLARPFECLDSVHDIMLSCWNGFPEYRPVCSKTTFFSLAEPLQILQTIQAVVLKCKEISDSDYDEISTIFDKYKKACSNSCICS